MLQGYGFSYDGVLQRAVPTRWCSPCGLHMGRKSRHRGRTGKGKWRGLNPASMMELRVPVLVDDVVYVLSGRAKRKPSAPCDRLHVYCDQYGGWTLDFPDRTTRSPTTRSGHPPLFLRLQACDWGRGKSSGSAVRDANAARDRADMERVTMHTGPRPRQRCRFVPVNFRKQAATDGTYGYKYW